MPLALDLLDRGADPNARNWRGIGALHFARALEHHALMDLLIARGARPEDRDVPPSSLHLRTMPGGAPGARTPSDGCSSPLSPRYLDASPASARRAADGAAGDADPTSRWRNPHAAGLGAGAAPGRGALPLEAAFALSGAAPAPAPGAPHGSAVAQQALRDAARLVAHAAAQRAAPAAPGGGAAHAAAAAAADGGAAPASPAPAGAARAAGEAAARKTPYRWKQEPPPHPPTLPPTARPTLYSVHRLGAPPTPPSLLLPLPVSLLYTPSVDNPPTPPSLLLPLPVSLLTLTPSLPSRKGPRE